MTRQRKDRGLRKIFRISVTSGIIGQIFSTLSGPGSAFLTKFAIMLNATPIHFAILSAIGQVSQIFQPIGAFVTKRRTKRKGVVLTLQFIGCGIALCFGVLPFIFSSGNAIYAFLLLFFLSVSLLSIASNAWIGWITGIIPSRVRGRFFSILSQYLMLTAVVVGFGFSLFIDHFNSAGRHDIINAHSSPFFKAENLPLGFAIIFIVAVVAAFFGLGVLSRLPEKEKKVEEEDAARMFLLPLRDGNFRKFLLFNCWWMLAVGIGAPFWQPFMLQKLHMSLFEVQIYSGINIAAAVLVLRLWGRLIDAYGNRTAMRIIIMLGGFNPMVWLFVTPQNYHFLYLEAITSGVMWAGAGLVATNFVLSIAPNERRQLYSGVSGAFSGLAMMTTMLVSGLFLPQYLQIGGIHLQPEQVLFGLTGIARWSAQIPLSLVCDRKSRPVTEAIAFFLREIKPRIMK
jgi:MFS family permease